MEKITLSDVAKWTGKAMERKPPRSVLVWFLAIIFFSVLVIPILVQFSFPLIRTFSIGWQATAIALIALAFISLTLAPMLFNRPIFNLVGRKSRKLQVRFVNGEIQRIRNYRIMKEDEEVILQDLERDVFDRFDNMVKYDIISHHEKGEQILDTEKIRAETTARLNASLEARIEAYHQQKMDLEKELARWQEVLAELEQEN